jgi:glutathione S-transferase
LKLYDTKGAPNPRRVRWFMAEKGVTDIEIQPINLLKGEHKTADYLAEVGLPVCPALVLDDGVVITESIAICRYLESRYPEPNLFGRDPEETAVIEMWTRRAEMMLSNPLMLCVRHSHPALAVLETQVPEVAANFRTAAEGAIGLFERRLGESAFIGGDRVTMADIVVIAGLDFARLIHFQLPETAPHFHRWSETMRARPAAGV